MNFSFLSSKDVELPEGAVSVLSNYLNISYILPGDYDVQKYEDGTWARYGYSTYVAESNGELVVMPNHSDYSSLAPHISQNVSYTYKDVTGDADGVYIDREVVISERCVG